MIDDALGAFLGAPVMMVVATRGLDGRAALARGVGARRGDADLIQMFASRWQWPEALAHLSPGAQAAMTFCRPSDYQAYQVKGDIVGVDAADEDGASFAAGYVKAVTAVLMTLGVEEGAISHWLTTEGLVQLTLRPRAVFLQTPGPSAGRALGGLA